MWRCVPLTKTSALGFCADWFGLTEEWHSMVHKWKAEVAKARGRNPFVAVAAHTNGRRRPLERFASEDEAIKAARKEVRKLNAA